MRDLDPDNCSHSNAHKEVISGQRTGEYVCDACGQSWTSSASLDAAQEAYEKKHAQQKTTLATRTHPVCANGVDFQVRVYCDGAVYRVAGYQGERQVTVGYSVTMTTDFDFRTYNGEWAVDHLVRAATKDIIEGRVAR